MSNKEEYEEFQHDDDDNEPELVFFRLTNGQDIVTIASEIDEDDDGPTRYRIIAPMKLEYSMDKKGVLHTLIVPWVHPKIVENQTFVLYIQDVLISSEVGDELADAYFKAYEIYIDKEPPKTKEQIHSLVKEELETQDRLEPSVRNNKKIKCFVKAELTRIRNSNKQ